MVDTVGSMRNFTIWTELTKAVAPRLCGFVAVFALTIGLMLSAGAQDLHAEEALALVGEVKNTAKRSNLPQSPSAAVIKKSLSPVSLPQSHPNSGQIANKKTGSKVISSKTPLISAGNKNGKKTRINQTTLKAANTKKRSVKRTKKRVAYKRSGICKDLDKLARRYKLPPLFFARLIWQESRFNPYAVSPAGAEGIAQFMPGTAAIWGLDDPFEPGQALIKSAQYLSYLHKKLGNLGFAAAGYNAGSGRVTRWLNGTSYMPLETRNYVRIITGYTIEDWADGRADFVGIRVKKKMPLSACRQLSIALRGGRGKIINASYSRAGKKARLGKSSLSRKMRKARSKRSRARAYARRLPRMAWGVQLAGSFSRAQAMKQFRSVKRKYGKIIGSKRIVLKSSRQKGRGRRIFHRVRIGAKTRTAANGICKRLKSAGGSCVVLKN